MYTLTYQKFHSYTEPNKVSWSTNLNPICRLLLIGTQHFLATRKNVPQNLILCYSCR